MGKDKRTHFWASYADLMTSLFFLMVVLFIISIVELKQIDATPLEVKELKAERDSLLNLNSRMVLRQKQYSEELDSMRYLANATQAHIDKINEINDATKNLDQNYFVYDSINKKLLYVLKLMMIKYITFLKLSEKNYCLLVKS